MKKVIDNNNKNNNNNKKSSNLLLVVIGIVVILGLIFLVSFMVSEAEEKRDFEDVSISISATSLLPALIHIADSNGYFLEEGVNVEIKGYSAGKFAFQAMLDDEVDIATVSDPNIVVKSFERNDFMTFTTIVNSADHVKVLTRKDTGIINPADLKGKIVATTKGTTAHFSMITFFVFNSLSLDDVELIDLKPGEMVEAIKSKQVDVIFTWEPNIIKAQRSLGEEANLLPNDYGYSATFNLASKTDLISEHPEVFEKIIRALFKAEKFVKQNKQESIEIVAVAVNGTKQDIEELWANYNFNVVLDHSLLLTLEDEARWYVENNLTDAKEVPNYLDYIHLNTLEKVKPEAIGIIR